MSEQSWENEWKTYYKPVRVTDTITIKPVWEDYQPESPDEKIVRLDPDRPLEPGRIRQPNCVSSVWKNICRAMPR